MHATELRQLCSSRDHEAIYARIQQEMDAPGLKNKLPTNDVEGLRALIEEEMRRSVYEQRGIPRPLVNITLLLGEDFEAAMRALVVSYMASVCSVDYQEFLGDGLQKLSSLEGCFVWMEESMARIGLRYSHVPDDWKLKQEVLVKYYLMTKQKACDYFFHSEVDEDDFLEAFGATVRHEKRLGRVFERHGCCACQPAPAEKQGVEAQAQCPHKKMVSSLFVPNIEIYLRRSFESLAAADLDASDVRVCIVSRFVEFFHGVERVFKKIEYLDDRATYRRLVQYFDEHLSILMRKMGVLEGLHGSTVVLNTLLFVRETAQDFVDQVTERSGVEGDIPRIHAQIRRVERLQNSSIDDYLSGYFARLDFSAPSGLSREIVQFLDAEVMSERSKGACEDVRITLVETVISHVFSKIYSIKITPRVSEALLAETAEIKKYLRTKVSVVPLIDVVEKYLKIFLCPPDNKKCFVENFILMSEGIFSFEQIIDSIGDGCVADGLYSAYEEAAGASDTQ